ncbi:hypothetical protein HDF16_003542 [Granulicella aggregans]|uniref:Uncharacterized protein n=1 Tax=Granulicella aggregans TaxID=474949 RepID=A0A7W7ZFM5_9BACT|nr:hypothetical protein [Granulicella aggregans]
MRISEAWNQNAPEVLVPYHGNQEGYGRVFFVLTMVEGAIAVALPWLDLRFIAHSARGGHHVWLALATNVLSLAAMSGFLRVYRALSKQITQGGPGASHLDNIRMTMASATSSMVFAGLALHMCGAWIVR